MKIKSTRWILTFTTIWCVAFLVLLRYLNGIEPVTHPELVYVNDDIVNLAKDVRRTVSFVIVALFSITVDHIIKSSQVFAFCRILFFILLVLLWSTLLKCLENIKQTSKNNKQKTKTKSKTKQNREQNKKQSKTKKPKPKQQQKTVVYWQS